MGCSTCGSSGVGAITQQRTTFGQGSPSANYSDDCGYTMEQFQAWLTLLICAKDKVLYPGLGITAQTLNKYLSFVMSALNYPTYPCNFAKDLVPVADFIILIQNTGAC